MNRPYGWRDNPQFVYSHSRRTRKATDKVCLRLFCCRACATVGTTLRLFPTRCHSHSRGYRNGYLPSKPTIRCRSATKKQAGMPRLPYLSHKDGLYRGKASGDSPSVARYCLFGLCVFAVPCFSACFLALWGFHAARTSFSIRCPTIFSTAQRKTIFFKKNSIPFPRLYSSVGSASFLTSILP